MGIFGETLIIYTSDHGEYLGDHHTGSKIFFHEPSVHIPFVLRMPKDRDRCYHGSTVDTPVTLADILPTLVVAAKEEISYETDGVDLISLTRGEVDKPRKYLEAMGAGAIHINLTIMSCVFFDFMLQLIYGKRTKNRG